MGFLLSKLLPLALYPLGLALLLQAGGLLGRRRRWGPWLSGAGIAVLWLASTPVVSHELVWQLEEQASRLTPAKLPRADAVLVLGGGLRPALPPRRGVEVNEAGDRLLTGVDLVRKGLAPWLILSGGRVSFTADDPAETEARSAAALAATLGIAEDRMLLSERARTTAEEAAAIQELARTRGWHTLLLVTSATHLPRAAATFRRRTDLTIVPVACDFQLPGRGAFGRATAASRLMGLLPAADALALTTVAIKEHVGLAAYRIRGWG
jgi:uncharacterized SAM-binding protein YcdF (DUF218 family)